MITRAPETPQHRAARYATKQLRAEGRNIARRLRLGLERATDRARLAEIERRLGGKVYGKKSI